MCNFLPYLVYRVYMVNQILFAMQKIWHIFGDFRHLKFFLLLRFLRIFSVEMKVAK